MIIWVNGTYGMGESIVTRISKEMFNRYIMERIRKHYLVGGDYNGL